MDRVIRSYWFSPLVSGVLTFIAVCQINFVISWVCYIPLFIATIFSSPKSAFKQGLIFGAAFSFAAFYWMIQGAERFTGHSIFYGIIVFTISLAFIAAFYASLIFTFALIKKPGDKPISLLVNSILIAAVFCVGEWLLTFVSSGLPWFDIHAGNGLTANDYSVQPASLFGIHILTFITILVNYLFAYFIAIRAWIKLYVPVAVIAAYLIAGYILLINFENNSTSDKSFQVAVLVENIAPEMKWDEKNGNFLVQKLLNLNRTAVALKPDMALWSESAVPWTYKKDDDLVNEILSITAPSQVTHILGINTDYKDNVIFNSAYCILPNGNVTNRYDKQYLLSFIEKPLSGLIMPFYSSAGFSAISDQQNSAPLNTPYGKAGVFICNEAAIPAAAAKMVNQGAQFLFNISNDGWFNDTYIVRLHYYYARLRAVEARKDLAINCNNGYSGLIKASGKIEEQERSEEPFVKLVSIQPNNHSTLATSMPDLFVYACFLYIIVVAVIDIIIKRKQPAPNYSFKA